MGIYMRASEPLRFGYSNLRFAEKLLHSYILDSGSDVLSFGGFGIICQQERVCPRLVGFKGSEVCKVLLMKMLVSRRITVDLVMAIWSKHLPWDLSGKFSIFSVLITFHTPKNENTDIIIHFYYQINMIYYKHGSPTYVHCKHFAP